MKGIILAAGNGSRMKELTSSPKCLLEIGGETLLLRQIRALRSCGISEITVVTGYQSERVRAQCDHTVEFVHNPHYRDTNSLHSLWLSRAHMNDGFVVLNCDVLFHTTLLSDLVQSPHGAALLVSRIHDEEEPLGAEEMKVTLRGSLVADISKDIDPRRADGENVGIAMFHAQEAALLVTHMERLVSSGVSKEWAPRAFKSFATEHQLHAVDTNRMPWIEIDVPADYERALTRIAPDLDR
jgi:L-glutamine-phosphate cytidylyltransferase